MPAKLSWLKATNLLSGTQALRVGAREMSVQETTHVELATIFLHVFNNTCNMQQHLSANHITVNEDGKRCGLER